MATRAERHPIIDAQITDEKEFKERLKELDNMSGEEAKEKLRTILEIIWEKRKKIAKGRKIRRVEDLQANLKRIQDETAKYVKEFHGR